MADLPATFELAEPPPVEPLLPSWSYGTAAVFIIGALLVVVASLLFMRKVLAPRRTTPESIRATAWKNAQRSFAKLDPANVRDAALGSSFIVRGYLAAAIGDPALFETHDEFLAREAPLAEFPEAIREKVRMLFSELAALKYGPEEIGDPAAIVARSRATLQDIHQGFTK
ncbi:MAG: hypothetical protein V4733_12760 [Verrucomicrobiota bacterium]